MDINIYKLLVNTSLDHPQEKNKLARIILSRDFYNQESKMPELFVLLEIDCFPNKNNKDVIDLLDKIELKIIERIQKIYNSISSRKSFQTDNLSEHLLELILKSLNSEIIFSLEENNSIDLKDKINIFAGVLEPAVIENEIKYYFHFSSRNKIKAFLIFQQQNSYKIMSILKESEEENRESKDKIFLNLTSGELENHSFLIICNKNLTDYVVVDKLKQLVISMGEKEIVKYLNNILSESDDELEFASIFISLAKTDDDKNMLSAENSIAKLMLTEKNTEKFLTPSIFPEFKNNFIQLGNYFRRIIRKIFLRILQIQGKILRLRINGKKVGRNLSEYKNKALNKAKYISFPTKNLKKYTGKIINYGFRCIGYFVDTCRKGMFLFFSKISGVTKRIKKVNFFTKIICFVFLSAIIFFWQGTQWLKNKREREQNVIIYNEALGELEQKFDSMEASLIYNNYEKASDTLNEIDIIMETTLAKNIEEYKKKYEELGSRVLDYKKKINKVVDITDPQLLSPRPDINSKIDNLILRDKTLVILDGLNNKLFELNLADNSINSWDSEKKLNNFAYYSESKGGIMAYEKTENKAFEFKDKRIKEIKTFMSGSIADIKSYSDSVYALDIQNNQIYVYRYTKREPWIKDNLIDLKKAIGMAIDGDIFVLKENGEVLKYFKGKKEKFSLQDIEPPLLHPSKLFTDAKTKKLYIMDKSNKRVIVFEKECKDARCPLVAQYNSDKFDDLKDFAVDEKAGIIYVLNGNEILKFDVN